MNFGLNNCIASFLQPKIEIFAELIIEDSASGLAENIIFPKVFLKEKN